MLVVSAVLGATLGSVLCVLRSALTVLSAVPAVPVVAARSLASARCSADRVASLSEVVAPLCVVLEMLDDSPLVAEERSCAVLPVEYSLDAEPEPVLLEMLDESFIVSECPLDEESADRSFDIAAARSSASNRLPVESLALFVGDEAVPLADTLVSEEPTVPVVLVPFVVGEDEDVDEPDCAVFALFEVAFRRCSSSLLLLDEWIAACSGSVDCEVAVPVAAEGSLDCED